MASSVDATPCELSSVSFGMYSPEEVRAISVTEVDSPIMFDNLNNPLPGGLYDPAMGPIDQMGRCVTCGNPQRTCPGHFGHIELPVPVYNPLQFDGLTKLMQATCEHCHHFRLQPAQTARFVRRFEALARGDVVGSLDTVEAAAAGDVGADAAGDGDDDESMSEGDCDGGSDEAQGKKRSAHAPRSKLVHDQYLALVGSFLRLCASGQKCGYCGRFNAKVKREGANKLFVKPVSEKQARANAMLSAKGDTAAPAEPAEPVSKPADGSETPDSDADGSDSDVDVLVEVGANSDKHQDAEEAATAEAKAAEATKVVADSGTKFLTADVVRDHVAKVWRYDNRAARHVWGGGGGGVSGATGSGAHAYFVEALLVAPNRFRPPSQMGDLMFEHPMNTALKACLEACLRVRDVGRALAGQNEGGGEDANDDEDGAEGAERRPKPTNQMWIGCWQQLQVAVSAVLDSDGAESAGVRQVLEKKEGLFRKNMMGKRVNFAARSVISPDPLIAPNEIGVPVYVAEGLTYPERVGAHNAEYLRAAVINGPRHYPGATFVEDAKGHTVDLSRLSRERRTNLAKTLLTVTQERRGGSVSTPFAKVVHRHLRDGDMMLVNRQPTLHRPSLMAHRARVLRGQRTIRMHYSNCSSYNADFDGDEINLHLPQDELARAEASEVVNADEQYIVPTSGGPIRGLIQDHVVMSVALTRRDTILDAERFQMLLYYACGSAPPTDYGDDRGKVHETEEEQLQIPEPAFLKPRRLWTGKQLLSSVLAHCARGRAPMNVEAGAKLSGALWGDAHEGRVVVRNGQLVTGVCDKAIYGRGGIVHAFQELYGCAAAGRLLHAFSKLFTNMLMWKGFSCGMEDLSLTPEHEDARSRELLTSVSAGEGVARDMLDKAGKAHMLPRVDRTEAGKLNAPLAHALGAHVRSVASAEVALDMHMTGALAPVSSAAIKACLPHGASRPFPDNQMAMMTSSGAKGSMVNSSQISVLLGQQELEGRRPPRMASGKTLPCFARFDPGARAGGFVGDRFLSGLRPPEYVFHAMAGREGLVDTTVKTSRSGYLQRCLIKCLEGLRVSYDYSVRDQDGSLVQFRYGEDGVDPTACAYLSAKHLSFVAQNAEAYAEAIGPDATPPSAAADAEARSKVRAERAAARDSARAPLLGERSPAEALGITSEAFSSGLDDYVASNPDGLLEAEAITSKQKKKKKKGAKTAERATRKALSREAMLAIAEAKYMRSLAPPGEAVGVIASQSIGEPSTQMTLNTFHFAGRGEANVTMGIPRLREIFMSASASIGLPVMTIPMRSDVSEAEAKRVAARLGRLALASVCDGVDVRESFESEGFGASVSRVRRCSVTLRLRPRRRWPREAALSWELIERAVRGDFVRQLLMLVKKELKAADGSARIVASARADADAMGTAAANAGGDDARRKERAAAAKRARKRERDGDDGDLDDVDEDELDATEARARGRGRETAAYDGRDAEDAAAEREAEAAARSRAGAGGGSSDTESVEEDGNAPEGAKRRGTGEAELERQATVTLDGSDGPSPTATVTFTIPAEASRILLLPLAQQAAVGAAVRATPGISRAFAVVGKGADAGSIKLQTDGVNFSAAWHLAAVGAEVDAVTSNDIAAMLRVYGVEAARATLVNEVSGVFGAYGIGVDPRHLGLVADYMTFEGDYRACSRLGIRSCTSPMTKMSFETAMTFVRDAALRGEEDTLESPSSRIIVGRPVGTGTGMCSLRYDVEAACAMATAEAR